MAERLQDRIRRGVGKREEQGGRHNPTIERFQAETGNTRLRKRHKRRARLITTGPRPASAPDVRTALRKAARREPQSPVALMLDDMSRVLTTFRKAEGRDPNAQDSEFWAAYKKIMVSRLG